jgi:hypothetical protein
MCDTHQMCYMCGLSAATKIVLRTEFKCDAPCCGPAGNWRLEAYAGSVKLQQTIDDPNTWLLICDGSNTGEVYQIDQGLDSFRFQNALQKLAMQHDPLEPGGYRSD